MKEFKGKALYQPKGKAGEYSHWACNFYVGCSNGCTYCFLKKGIGKATLGGDKPTLKKCFKDETHALKIFESELLSNVEELRKHGIFFSFTTDPMLPETIDLTLNAAGIAVRYGVQVKILTKCADWVDEFIEYLDKSNSDNAEKEWRKDYAFGFTLTGHDELEPNASTNKERIYAIEKLHRAGFKTFASIEPIVDVGSSFSMLFDTAGFCDLYKVGLMSGKEYKREELLWLIEKCHGFSTIYKEYNFPIKFYFKDSLLKQAGIKREDLPENCVGRDYNLFNQ